MGRQAPLALYLRLMVTRFEDIDWSRWVPQERATELFVRRDGQILLIRKKRGLGAGKVVGPGGRIAPYESPLQAAVREVQEELGITPTGVQASGELSFQFRDGYSLLVYVFTATGCEGEAQETEEAVPLWTPLERVPFDQMWADDYLWFPLLLSSTPFSGRFLFDGDALLGHALSSLDNNMG